MCEAKRTPNPRIWQDEDEEDDDRSQAQHKQDYVDAYLFACERHHVDGVSGERAAIEAMAAFPGVSIT